MGYNKVSGNPQFTFPMLHIRNMWRKAIKGGGAARLESLTSSSDDMGAYFGAYFRNLEHEARANKIDGTIVSDKQGKKYEKGKRLHFYPPYMKFYRCSQNVARPVKGDQSYLDCVAEYGEPVFEKSYAVVEKRPPLTVYDENNEITMRVNQNNDVMQINQVHFNKSRSPKNKS
jgi:hypothetical protein